MATLTEQVAELDCIVQRLEVFKRTSQTMHGPYSSIEDALRHLGTVRSCLISGMSIPEHDALLAATPSGSLTAATSG